MILGQECSSSLLSQHQRASLTNTEQRFELYIIGIIVVRVCLGVGQHKKVENCKVLVANTPMDTDKIKIYGARVKVDSFEAVQALEEAEREKMKQKVTAS